MHRVKFASDAETAARQTYNKSYPSLVCYRSLPLLLCEIAVALRIADVSDMRSEGPFSAQRCRLRRNGKSMLCWLSTCETCTADLHFSAALTIVALLVAEMFVPVERRELLRGHGAFIGCQVAQIIIDRHERLSCETCALFQPCLHDGQILPRDHPSRRACDGPASAGIHPVYRGLDRLHGALGVVLPARDVREVVALPAVLDTLKSP